MVPASWSGTTTNLSNGAYDVVLPQPWSGFSVAAPPERLQGCTYVQFDVSTSTTATLNFSLNNGANQSAGVIPVVIGPDTPTVRIDLNQFAGLDGSVTRFTLQNTGTPGVTFAIDNIGFGPTGSEPEPQPSSAEPCKVIYSDAVNSEWQPASWTVTNMTQGEQLSATFPRRWGALSHSVSQGPVSVAGCTALSFDIRASVPNSKFHVRLNTANQEVALDDQEITVGTTDTPITIPLDSYTLVNDLVTRVSIINKADSEGTSIVVDNLQFTRPVNTGPGEPQPEQPEPEEPQPEEPQPEEPQPEEPEPDQPVRQLGSGVNVTSAEYVCVHNQQENGYSPTEVFDHRLAGISHQQFARHLKNFGVKTARIPLNSHCWLGGFDYIDPNLQGQRYKNELKALVDALRAEGIVSWLELHWTAHEGYEADFTGPNESHSPYLPDADYAPVFWAAIANQYKSYGDDVIYSPLNETATDRWFSDSDTAWTCWRDGCQGPDGLQYAGMQQMVNAIRSSGSDQLIMLGGLDFSYDKSRWLEFLPNDPSSNLGADIHIYDFKSCVGVSCFETDVLNILNAGHPVLIGELGQGVDDDSTVCQSYFIDPIMDWADANNIGYLGWRYNAGQGAGGCASFGPGKVNGIMTLVETWDGTTTTPMGEALRARLVQQ